MLQLQSPRLRYPMPLKQVDLQIYIMEIEEVMFFTAIAAQTTIARTVLYNCNQLARPLVPDINGIGNA